MADDSFDLDINRSDSPNKTTFSRGPSIFLLIRSYEEARNVFAIILSINLVVIVLGIIVNASICYVMVRKKRYQRNGSNFFIMHLSMMELTYSFIVFPIIISFAVPTSEIKSIQCKACETCASAIFVSLVAIATDRYQNIVHPLKTLKSKKKPVLLVCLVWLYAVIVSCPSVVSVESISVREIPEAGGMYCNDCADKKLCDIPQTPLGQSSTTLYFLLAFFVPLVVISVLYTKIAIFLHKRSHTGMMNKLAARSKTKAVRMLIVIVFAYVLSLGPAVILVMLRSYGVFNNSSFDVMLLVNWVVEFVTYTSSLGNPLIYAYYNGDFRRELLGLFRKKRGKNVHTYMVTFANSNRES